MLSTNNLNLCFASIFSSFRLFSKTRGKKSAFTLPEVLMTLLVIGVVVAMTIPNLITKNYEYTTIRKVKKFHSAMNQSIRMANEDIGEVTDWNLPSNASKAVDQFVETIGYYYKWGVYYGVGNQQKKFTHTYKYLGTNQKWSTYKSNNQYAVLETIDGGLVFIKVLSPKCNYSNNQEDMKGDVCAIIFYDVNGKYLPNTFGKDLFEFLIKNDVVIPRFIDKDKCYLKQGQGEGCAFHVIYNSTMDYLH